MSGKLILEENVFAHEMHATLWWLATDPVDLRSISVNTVYVHVDLCMYFVYICNFLMCPCLHIYLLYTCLCYTVCVNGSFFWGTYICKIMWKSLSVSVKSHFHSWEKHLSDREDCTAGSKRNTHTHTQLNPALHCILDLLKLLLPVFDPSICSVSFTFFLTTFFHSALPLFSSY